jgi:hypothetical protein
MSKQAELIQYTIRGVPPEVDRLIRRKAARTKQSINQVILDELVRATVGNARKADFSDLVGRWMPDPAFDEIVAAQRQVDWDKWK